MRRKIVAGNWKMNLDLSEARELYKELTKAENKPPYVDLYIFPPSIYLYPFSESPSFHLHLGAQNFYPAEKGAFTGEVSVSQIKSLGIQHVLIGHSERRVYFGEHDAFLKEKVDAAVKHDLKIIFCCGEPISVREKGNEKEFVLDQLEKALFHLDENDIADVTLAYEPIWAIGTGLTATVEQAEDMHREIRSWIKDKYTTDVANKISILYGGSCNADNAQELFACPNVDGGLIGGASLKAQSFLQIANCF